jgi:hypothetical protein
MIIRLWIALSLLLSAWLPISSAAAAWPATGSYTAWSTCFELHTKATKVDAALDWYWLDLSVFPPAFWAAVKPDGADLRFVRDDMETAINHRLIFIDSGTSKGLVALSQPHGSAGASTDIYSFVFVGNNAASSTSTASTFQSTLEALYMMQEAPTTNTAILDYSGNARDSTTVQGAMTSGDLITGGPHSGLKAVDFDSNDRVAVPSTIFDDSETAGAFTWSGWVYVNDDVSDAGVFGSAGAQFYIRHTDSGNFRAELRNSANSAYFTAEDTTNAWNINQWYMASVVYNGSTLKTYLNGVQKSSVTATSMRSAALSFYLGMDNTNYLRGRLADISIRSVALSVDQLATMYTNVTDSTFWGIDQVDSSASIWFHILIAEE